MKTMKRMQEIIQVKVGICRFLHFYYFIYFLFQTNCFSYFFKVAGTNTYLQTMKQSTQNYENEGNDEDTENNLTSKSEM